MEKKSVGLTTLGCKVSQYETEAVAEEFSRRGFTVCPFEEKCDVYVVNTCTVTAESDRKSRQVIRRAYRTNPDALIFVMGCYAQTSPAEILPLPGVVYVSGTDGKMKIPAAAEEMLTARTREKICAVTPLDGAAFEKMTVCHAPRTRAYVKIEDGCECRCTYCAIPGARGGVRSKAPEDILAEIETLAASGTREVVLTGIETASYGVDNGKFRLIDLLEYLDKNSSVERIRLGSLTPEVMRGDFVSRLSALKKPVPHFHLSMQSGSDDVLRGMKRRYNTAQALSALSALREAMPVVCFTTDMMVGFPGETDENFEETLAFSEKAHFLGMHVFAYSPRKNTPAAEYPDQVPEEIKHARSARLIALAARMKQENLDTLVSRGKPLSVLFETRAGDVWTGHSDEFAEVRVMSKENLHGKLFPVKPESAAGGVILGELISE